MKLLKNAKLLPQLLLRCVGAGKKTGIRDIRLRNQMLIHAVHLEESDRSNAFVLSTFRNLQLTGAHLPHQAMLRSQESKPHVKVQGGGFGRKHGTELI